MDYTAIIISKHLVILIYFLITFIFMNMYRLQVLSKKWQQYLNSFVIGLYLLNNKIFVLLNIFLFGFV